MKATITQIKKAISYDNEMSEKYPNKEVLYFIGDDTRKDRILKELANNIYWDFCESKNATGCFEIYKLLINREIPEDIIKFYVENGCGGCLELDLFYFVYDIGNSSHETLEDVKNDMLEFYKENRKEINDIFKDKVVKPTLDNIVHDLCVNGESSTFYKQLTR